MFDFIRRKLTKNKIRKTFQEYGYKLKSFALPQDGNIEYAQWLHPFESEKEIGQPEVNFIRKYVKPGDFVIDIGAHTGDSTIPLALAAGPTGAVLALEPNKYVFKVLDKNASLNRAKTNIIPRNFAASLQDGPLVFNYSDASFCNGGDPSRIQKVTHAYKLEVQAKNLAQYLETNHPDLLPKLTFFKVDAEGFDKEIVKSVKAIIQQFKPTILSECYVGLSKEERFEYFELLTELGYILYRLDGLFSDSMTLLETKNNMLDKKHFDFLAVRK